MAGTRLGLLPERVAYWPDEAALLVADAHFGKAASFRRLGVPVPEETTARALTRLAGAVDRTGAQRVIFLGDLLHSALAKAPGTVDAVARWRAARPALRWTLVVGNHDRRAGRMPEDWGVEIVDTALSIGPFALAHEPDPQAGRYTLCGHVHPGVVFGARGHDRIRLPCFHFGPSLGVLPAFGEFTGLHVLRRGEGDRVFVVADDQVRALPPR